MTHAYHSQGWCENHIGELLKNHFDFHKSAAYLYFENGILRVTHEMLPSDSVNVVGFVTLYEYKHGLTSCRWNMLGGKYRILLEERDLKHGDSKT